MHEVAQPLPCFRQRLACHEPAHQVSEHHQLAICTGDDVAFTVVQVNRQGWATRERPCAHEDAPNGHDHVSHGDHFDGPARHADEDEAKQVAVRRHQVRLVMVEGTDGRQGKGRGFPFLCADEEGGRIDLDGHPSTHPGQMQPVEDLTVQLHRAGRRRHDFSHPLALGGEEYECSLILPLS